MSKDLVDQNKNHKGVFSQPGIEPTISSSKFKNFFVEIYQQKFQKIKIFGLKILDFSP